MSMQLMKFLLADARDFKDSGPSPYEGDSNLTLAIQRHGPSHVRARARNRLSLDLDLAGPHQAVVVNEPMRPQVTYRRTASDIAALNHNRRSLNLEFMNKEGQHPKIMSRRTVHFDLPDSPEAARRYLQKQQEQQQMQQPQQTRRRCRPPDRREDSPSDAEGCGVGEHVGVSPRLLRLLDIKPKDYAEAQRLKKMLKRAVNRPDTTFEDLKVYRLAMKRLRRIIRQEQEMEMLRQAEEERQENFQNFIDKVE
ncbi:hypothetical protein Hamer_G019752 [Homarus americanus]|uniref:Uncharacterized protein n=1 Tax=Homarus americanus TaxID=6706 RepID=A0A8J5KAN0_HOMAM|nr:hypothetical protein Hamer_G019752 [Homarus americanus]